MSTPPFNADRQLAEQEARRRMAAGTQVAYFDRYVDAIMRDPIMMATLRNRPESAEPGATVADIPAECQHRNKADLGDVLMCVACHKEWIVEVADAS